MILPLQTFTSVLEAMSAGLQGRAAQLVDLSVGSVLRALLEACASAALWMQWLILQVLSMTRASTSVGADLDSWMADFSFSRLAGAYSIGSVTLSRFTPGLSATIPAGTTVLTSDSGLSFTVIGDVTNPAWNQALSAYSIPATASSVTVLVQASVAGTAGNVLAGTIALLGTAVPGVDQVSNTKNFAGGIDVEPDDAFRSRFQLYINSRSLGTSSAVGAAISALQLGVRYCVLENVDLAGDLLPGNFCVIVDDGTGHASTTLLEAASSAIDAVRPVGTTFSVSPAAILPVSIQMTILMSASGVASAVVLAVEQAISSWVGGLPMGGRIAVSKLEALAHGVGNSVLSVPTTLVNGASVDLAASAGAVFNILSINVSAD